jgi:hypothetical protein
MLTALFSVVFLCLFVFWCYQFAGLMLLSDSDFPGKYDKIIWVVVFLLVFPAAPFAFVLWKHAHMAVRTAEARTASWKQKYLEMRTKETGTQE